MSVERIIEIASNNRHLSIFRGFMVVSEGKEELGRIPIDDINAVIANAHGITYSNNLITALAERGIPLVICGNNHVPTAFLWPVDGHHTQSARIDAQIKSTKPMSKQLWKQVIRAKIKGQATILESLGKTKSPVEFLILKVKSGDPENIEAQAARRYWEILFGTDFHRNRQQKGENAMLNYGYTIIRSSVARALIASGLHPGIGIHHQNIYNHMRLVDDMMEPYRPYVDFVVWHLVQERCKEISTEIKPLLASILEMAIPMNDKIYPMRHAIQKTIGSLARIYENGKITKLDLPKYKLLSWQMQENGYGTFERVQADVDDGYV